MNDPAKPAAVPEQTLPQSGSVPSPTVAPDSTPRLPTANDGNATGTLVTPADYDPSAVAGATKSSKIDYKPTSLAELGISAGRYYLLRELARGGMGQVSIARDTELDREIALKEIQPKYKVDSAILHRFMLEARVTGKLEHPGIVPVYGLGSYPDGRPYYAMRFITGKSLQEAIDDFHAKESPSRDPQERSLALRQLLRRFGDVCNTIGYAHSRGFLHRDLKPSNVMVGGFGETLVVDWGLAKEMLNGVASGGREPPDSPSDETLVHKPATPDAFQETQEGFTLYGQTMGTPAFMSPEQAAGKWDITGIASDVYSLGAMLYAILSGTPPYSGPSFEVITKVQRGEFKPVKLVKGNVPAPLDAIVRKAMAFDIKDRYPGALALGADVERWLADEPVSCFRERFSTRARRWARRHRTAVIAASALLVTGTIALAVGLVAVNRERKEKEKAYLVANESRGETREALLALTDDALGEILAASNKPTPQQVKFLDTIIERYRHFAEKEADSPETKLFVAGAWYRVGRLEARVERYEKASEAYDKSLAMLTDDSIAALPEARRTRGDVQLYGGILALQQQKPQLEAEAETKLRAAMATFRELIAADPKPENRFRLAQAEDRLGTLYAIQRRYPEAGKLFQDSLAAREQLAKEFPADPEYKFRVVQSYRQLADVAFRTNKPAEGRELAGKARDIVVELATDHKTSVAYLRLLADLDTLLTAHYTAPRPRIGPKIPLKDSPAVFHARAAARTWSQIAALTPGDSTVKQRQAEANINLARQYQNDNQAREALAAHDAALAILGELDRDEPNNLVTLTKLLQSKQGRVSLLHEIGDKKAGAAADDAVRSGEALVNGVGRQSGEARTYAALARKERALILINAKKFPEAKADLDASWPLLQGSSDVAAVLSLAQACADWMAAADDYDPIVATEQGILALKLPKGQSQFVAACLHGRVARQLLDSPKAEEDAWFKFAQKQIDAAVHALRLAASEGFDNVESLADPDLLRLRDKVEFQEIVEAMKPKSTPKAKDN